ncbi:MAG TPA: hypothetical protein VFS77_09685 [Pyrinomonadaceae bacterium]|nr:hypothetical protein [Pyrinomonadaceae bacterium]
MSRFLITTLFAIVLFLPAQDNFTLTEVVRNYDPLKNKTTVTLAPTQISGPKDRYQSLSYSIYFSYPGSRWTLPKEVNFELVSVVNAQELNSDLYVVFLIDGKEVHFSSNRSAIPKPVPEKPWIGERMVFMIPREQFMKMAGAQKLGVKLGGVSFEFDEAARASLRSFADTIRVSGP